MIDAMKQALEALEWNTPNTYDDNAKRHDAITALRQAIEQAEKQEPVAWMAWNMPDDRYEITTDKRRLPAGTPLYALDKVTK